ncbi:glycosyltransferase [Tripterygium wilfordii]|uniref:Glycosyltransferase n=1 Tax=Tripterygium wilfordii TaxID=458696 RepID=A0A7J7BWH8_TRIWF|nr:probable glycosyltransferase At5g03795 [Tripterygium wilfordii]KAF5726188.1 glycosyltransferase [Tripterygium wilfordii]
MGHDFRSVCKMKESRWPWLVGVVFVTIIAIQCFELPYGNVVLSLFSASKFPVAGETIVRADGPVSNFGVTGRANDSHIGGDDDSETSEKNNVVVNKNESPGIDEGADPEEEEESEKWVEQNIQSGATMENVVKENEWRFPKENATFISKDAMNSSDTGSVSHLSPQYSPSNVTFPETVDTTVRTTDTFVFSYPSSTSKDVAPTTLGNTPSATEESGKRQSDLTPLDANSHLNDLSEKKKTPKILTSAVVSISEMKDLLLQSRASHNSMRPRWPSKVDDELRHAKSLIENAPIIKNDPVLYAPLFWNISMFKRSYEIMESMLKVYVYKEGERPIIHLPILKGIYASEGWFMKQMEGNKRFITKKPGKAHLFYLPFSSRMLEETLYVPNSHNHKNLIKYLENYVDMIAAKYRFWNRTEGADHFLVACHDWAPAETRHYMRNCIRALCNSDVKEGFTFGKDVSLPETFIRMPKNPLRDLGGKPASKRSILAFFAGNMHGYLRPILLQHWENKDPDMKIYGKMPKSKNNRNYIQHMKSSKYCICAKGFEVNSPRVVEAIFYECVPVIISDNFVPPFLETLNWESFAVFVLEKDIPNLKNILVSISDARYRVMQTRVKRVQQHFLWHPKPVKYDLFHMILHSIWFNRVFQMNPR